MSVERNTRVRATQIKSIFPVDLDSTNVLATAMDGYVPTYDEATGKFTWAEQTGGGIQSIIKDADNDTSVDVEKTSDIDKIYFKTAGQEQLVLEDGALLPITNDDISLGNTNYKFKELYLMPSALYLGTTNITENIFNRNEINIVLNAFRIAINGSLSRLSMVDGVVDEFEDETGIDQTTGQSENYLYESTDDYYEPSREYGGIDTDTKLMLHCNGTNDSTTFTDSSDTGHTVTAYGDAKLKTTTKKWGTASGYFDGTGDFLKTPSHSDWENFFDSNTSDRTIDFWFKHSTGSFGNEDIFTVDQDGSNFYRMYYQSGFRIDVVSGGSNILAIPASASTQISDTDWHHFAYIKVGNDYGIYIDGDQKSHLIGDNDTMTLTSAPLRIGIYVNESSNPYNGYIDEFRIQYGNPFEASPNVGDTDTITVPTGEYSGVTGVDNMTLISTDDNAEATPSSGRIVLFEEDVDSLTLNTDIKGYISRDGGVTWAQVTLADEGDYENGKRILTGTVDLTQTGIGTATGNPMRFKVETLNEKDMKLHGASLLWD